MFKASRFLTVVEIEDERRRRSLVKFEINNGGSGKRSMPVSIGGGRGGEREVLGSLAHVT